MSERLMLYLGILAIFWLFLWLFRKESRPSTEDDPTPFAMRSGQDIEKEIVLGRKITRRRHF